MEADVEKVQDQLMATLLPFQVCIFYESEQKVHLIEPHEFTRLQSAAFDLGAC